MEELGEEKDGGKGKYINRKEKAIRKEDTGKKKQQEVRAGEKEGKDRKKQRKK